jgi:hypothetical protein
VPAKASETETATARAALLGEMIFIARQSFFELVLSQQRLARATELSRAGLEKMRNSETIIVRPGAGVAS